RGFSRKLGQRADSKMALVAICRRCKRRLRAANPSSADVSSRTTWSLCGDPELPHHGVRHRRVFAPSPSNTGRGPAQRSSCASTYAALIRRSIADDVPWKGDLVTEPPRTDNGHLIVPTKPGWGADVNEAAVRKRA